MAGYTASTQSYGRNDEAWQGDSAARDVAAGHIRTIPLDDWNAQRQELGRWLFAVGSNGILGELTGTDRMVSCSDSLSP